jgi:DNA-directed RNA polymerase subunit E'/Rpb7
MTEPRRTSFILIAKEFMKVTARDYLPAIAFTPKRMEEGKGKVSKVNKYGCFVHIFNVINNKPAIVHSSHVR